MGLYEEQREKNKEYNKNNIYMNKDGMKYSLMEPDGNKQIPPITMQSSLLSLPHTQTHIYTTDLFIRPNYSCNYSYKLSCIIVDVIEA